MPAARPPQAEPDRAARPGPRGAPGATVLPDLRGMPGQIYNRALSVRGALQQLQFAAEARHDPPARPDP
jgi:hypothetical protein